MPGLTASSARAGCLLGLLVGDAAGAVLEFQPPENITPAAVDRAMTMPGGGVWELGPGQVTDDSELALSLAAVLAQTPDRSRFPSDRVARAYYQWRKSEPFDVGQTCRSAFTIGKLSPGDTDADVERRMRQNAQKYNKESKGNGGLMRIAPLAIWLSGCSRVTEADVAKYAHADGELSHPNRTCLDCNAAYCLALWHLMRHPGDSAGALACAVGWARAHAVQEVQEWLMEESTCIDILDVNKAKGFVRWGFVQAFYFLRQGTPYADALRATLLMGGDTDTNAAIVGAMLGCLHGAGSIPKHMANAVLRFKAEQGQHRPAEFLPIGVVPIIAGMCGIPTGSSSRAGCMLGLMVGDAVGGLLEHKPPGSVDAAAADWAMQLPGGGHWGLGPGQVTDDSELALSLAAVLAQAPDTTRFPSTRVAVAYTRWFNSKPFDVGGTFMRAFSFGLLGPQDTYADVERSMRQRALQRNAESKGNGALMRITPLAIWLAQRKPEVTVLDVVKHAHADGELSHPNRTCLDCNAAYCLALWHLMRHPGDSAGALACAVGWANANAVKEVRKWLAEDSMSLKGVDVSNEPAFVRWPVLLAFHFLRKQATFPAALRATLLLGGDTNTNAAVVGAMMGALHGFGAIPEHMHRRVLQFKPPGQPGDGHAKKHYTGRSRPLEYTPGGQLHVIYDLCDHPVWW